MLMVDPRRKLSIVCIIKTWAWMIKLRPEKMKNKILQITKCIFMYIGSDKIWLIKLRGKFSCMSCLMCPINLDIPMLLFLTNIISYTKGSKSRKQIMVSLILSKIREFIICFRDSLTFKRKIAPSFSSLHRKS